MPSRCKQLLFVCALLCTASPSWAQRKAGDAYFDAEGVRRPITIRASRLAVLLQPGASVDRLAPAFQRHGLRIDERHRGNLVVLVAEQPRGRVAQIARKLKAEGKELLVAAGLAVTTPGARTPAILDDEVVLFVREEKELQRILAENRLTLVSRNPFVRGQYLARLAGDPLVSALEVANELRKKPGVVYAFPNFYSVAENFETIPADPFFAAEWHHRNTGASGGTVGADARMTLAWDLTQGSTATLLAINELFGLDTAHEDLAANLWTNTAEIAGNGVDDDANGYVDDVNGWNFTACSTSPVAGCGNATLTPAGDTLNDAHATEVAGVAIAPSGNGVGVAGGCPSCRFMPLVLGSANSDFQKALPFGYAQNKGATIITNSWGGGGPYPATTTAINAAATNGRGGLGIPIFFAAGNTAVDICAGANQAPLASLANVIAVSSSSNLDRWVTSHGFGNCVALLAPTRWGAAEATPSGTLGITTADRTGAAGTNSNNNDCLGALVNPANLNYSNCFSGTSSATPLAASVAGLILSVNPGLTAAQVRNLLQDTADKVEDSAGAYAEATGYSTPPGGTATHAFGRVNAFESVRIAAPAASGGKGGVDAFIRDNRLDWGNTDRPSNTLFEPVRGFIPHWQSVDVKVDAPSYQPAPTNNAQFEALIDENAQSGSLNRIYVRVRNRGPVTAASVTVKAHWAFAGAGLPSLPPDFWTAFPGDSATTAAWHPLGAKTVTNLAYSGVSVAGGAADAAQILEFDFNGPPVDPAQPNPHHFCIFVVLDSPQDRVGPKAHALGSSDFIPDALTPTDNNVTHRNIVVEGAGGASDFADLLFVHNPFDTDARVLLHVLSKSALVRLDPLEAGEPFSLKPREHRLVKFRLAPPKERYAEVTIVQRSVSGRAIVTGGMTYRFGKPPREKPGRLHFSQPGRAVVKPVANLPEK